MTSTDVATRNGGTPAHYAQAALAISPGQDHWDKMQLAALAQLGIKDASEGDQAVFLHVCQRTGLDPFSQQIYMIPRREWDAAAKAERVRWTIQTGIKGLRVIRARAEKREGVRGILSRFTYYDTDGTGHPVWVQKLPPVACEVTYTARDANGTETAYTSVLRFAEYCQHNKDGKAMAQWAPDQKPVHMLEKCTEADVYAKAFPTDFAGLLLDDAMPPPEPLDVPPPKVTGEEIRRRRPVQAKAEVVPPAGDHPWPGDAAPAQPAAAAAAPDEAAEAADPREEARERFARLRITGHESQMNYAGQLLDIAPPATLDALARVQAVKLALRLSQCQTKADLDTMLKTGEVPGE